MDQLRECVAVLRRLAKEPDDPDCVVLAEQAINDYLRNEVEALRAALERIGKAIDEEAAKGQGEDWSLMVGYVQSCREKLPGAIEEWQKD
jgi:hypothetical protein